MRGLRLPSEGITVTGTASLRSERTSKMLALIKERLDSIPTEELLEQLHSCRCDGPTLDEFQADLQEMINSRATP